MVGSSPNFMKSYINMVGTLHVFLSVYSRLGIAQVRIVPRNIPGSIDNTDSILTETNLQNRSRKIVPRKARKYRDR